VASARAAIDHPAMPGKRRSADGIEREIPPNKITAWRNFRKLTLEQLAELTGLSTATLSDMANRKADVTGKSLLDLAKALRTTPGALLEADPRKAQPWWEIWENLSSRERDRAIAHIKVSRDNP
jgi:transcriptional regulator with XRE-family HTH domain